MNTDKVRVVEPFDTDHTQAYELRSIPMERLHDMPFVMNIIKVTPRTSTTYTARWESKVSPRASICSYLKLLQHAVMGIPHLYNNSPTAPEHFIVKVIETKTRRIPTSLKCIHAHATPNSPSLNQSTRP